MRMVLSYYYLAQFLNFPWVDISQTICKSSITDNASMSNESENPTASPTSAIDLNRSNPEVPSDETTDSETASVPAAYEIASIVPAETSSQIPGPTTEDQTSGTDDASSIRQPSSSQNPPLVSVRHVAIGVETAPHNPQIFHGKKTRSNWFNWNDLEWNGLEWTMKDIICLVRIFALMCFSGLGIVGIIHAFPATAVAVSLTAILYWYIPAAERATFTKCFSVACICLVFLRASQGNWTLQSCYTKSHNITESDSVITMKNTNLTCVVYVINPMPTSFEFAKSINGTDVRGLMDSTDHKVKWKKIAEEANQWMRQINNQFDRIFSGFENFYVAIDQTADRLSRRGEKMDEFIQFLQKGDNDRNRQVMYHRYGRHEV